VDFTGPQSGPHQELARRVVDFVGSARVEQLEKRAIAQAGPDGHVCGRERVMTGCAVGIPEHFEAQGATDVFVFPEETYIQYADRVVRYRNGPEMIEVMDKYLLTGELPSAAMPITLLPFGPGEQ
jgi:hypothetical protein